ncbi:hypothetical protein DBB_39060 [Desulfoluna spongiiphila]|nr:hypothetical protein DBB_39060 [Desulfoluna spongiiphila]
MPMRVVSCPYPAMKESPTGTPWMSATGMVIWGARDRLEMAFTPMERGT